VLARGRDIFPILLRRMARLLLARDPVPREEPPHGSIAEAQAVALPYLLAQFHDRHVRLCLDLREDEVGVRLNAAGAAITTRRRWRNLARGLVALHPAHRARDA